MYKWHLDISKLEQNCSFFHKRLLERQTSLEMLKFIVCQQQEQ